MWRIWNCKHDWIPTCSIRGKSHVGYSCKDGGIRDAATRAVAHLITNKVASTVADAAKKRKRVDIDAKHSQEPQLKKTFVDTGDIDIIDGSGIVLE